MSYLHFKYAHYSQLLSATQHCSNLATLTTKLWIITHMLTSSRCFQNAANGGRGGCAGECSQVSSWTYSRSVQILGKGVPSQNIRSFVGESTITKPFAWSCIARTRDMGRSLVRSAIHSHRTTLHITSYERYLQRLPQVTFPIESIKPRSAARVVQSAEISGKIDDSKLRGCFASEVFIPNSSSSALLESYPENNPHRPTDSQILVTEGGFFWHW